MRVLIAEDDSFFQKLLEQVLAPEHEIVLTQDGNDAWEAIQRPDSPRLAILDWVMPGMSGPEICRKVRASAELSSMYLIILTAKNNEADIVSGLRAGADDYITKPPVPAELRARVRVGERILALQDAVSAQSAMAEPASKPRRPAGGLLAACALCQPKPQEKNCCGFEPCPFEPIPNHLSSCGETVTRVSRLSDHFLENSHSER